MPKPGYGACGAGCCWMMVAGAVLWWLIASGLLLLTWNRVVAAFAAVKPAKLWHALLVVATLAVLCLPNWAGRGCGMRHKSCCAMHGGGADGGCPWHKPGGSPPGTPGDSGQ